MVQLQNEASVEDAGQEEATMRNVPMRPHEFVLTLQSMRIIAGKTAMAIVLVK
jgi:hypothetical protein